MYCDTFSGIRPHFILGLLGAIVGGMIAWWRFRITSTMFDAIGGATFVVAAWRMLSLMKSSGCERELYAAERGETPC
ncbi:MAG TPA: hypothetical protein PK400_09490 [Phycisphaerales bacterium]|nr:hypothetical protein [Phycisphaerales bacterium]